MYDLAENVEMAKKILEPIHRFFDFSWSLSRFSGFAREAKPGGPEAGPLFYVQFWTKRQKIWRSVEFRNIGYTGVLHVEGIDEEDCDVDYTIGIDFVAELVQAIGEFRLLPNAYEETCIPTVEGNQILLPIPWRTR